MKYEYCVVDLSSMWDVWEVQRRIPNGGWVTVASCTHPDDAAEVMAALVQAQEAD